MSIDEAIPTWNRVESNHPTHRGAFDWQIHIDESLGWQFADGVGPSLDRSGIGRSAQRLRPPLADSARSPRLKQVCAYR